MPSHTGMATPMARTGLLRSGATPTPRAVTVRPETERNDDFTSSMRSVMDTVKRVANVTGSDALKQHADQLESSMRGDDPSPTRNAAAYAGYPGGIDGDGPLARAHQEVLAEQFRREAMDREVAAEQFRRDAIAADDDRRTQAYIDSEEGTREGGQEPSGTSEEHHRQRRQAPGRRRARRTVGAPGIRRRRPGDGVRHQRRRGSQRGTTSRSRGAGANVAGVASGGIHVRQHRPDRPATHALRRRAFSAGVTDRQPPRVLRGPRARRGAKRGEERGWAEPAGIGRGWLVVSAGEPRRPGSAGGLGTRRRLRGPRRG